MIKEGDLMMISESDVFISTDRVLQPLDNAGYKAWIYWVCNLSSKNILTTSFACLFANHLKLWFFLKFTLCEENWTKVEPALYGGETFAMSFTTLRKVEREHQIKKALFITAFNKNVICTEFFCINFPPGLLTKFKIPFQENWRQLLDNSSTCQQVKLIFVHSNNEWYMKVSKKDLVLNSWMIGHLFAWLSLNFILYTSWVALSPRP